MNNAGKVNKTMEHQHEWYPLVMTLIVCDLEHGRYSWLSYRNSRCPVIGMSSRDMLGIECMYFAHMSVDVCDSMSKKSDWSMTSL